MDTCCRALSERLGKETYFFGRQPTPLDALVYGHLYTIITTPLQDTRLASIVNGYSNLVKLTNHVDAEYFKGMEIHRLGWGEAVLARRLSWRRVRRCSEESVMN